MAGLQNPWDMAFTPDGALLYTERGRGLSVRRSDGSTALLFKPADMVAQGQSGMQGVVIDPQFATNRTLYVYMSSNAGGSTNDNRVLRLTVDANYTAVANRTDIVTGISYKNAPSAGAPAGTGAHSGGRIRFGPDNLLYITTGDNHNAMVPQSKTELGGKVLRVDTQGAAASANNPPTGYDKRIFAYGFRNPQGIAFRSNGQVFTAEHGPGHSDEVTRVVNGGNAGWDPGCLDNAQAYCGYGSNQPDGSVTPMTDTVKFPGAMRPAWNNGGASAGIAGNTFLSGSQWKLWDGAMAVAFMNGNRIEILRLNADGSLLSNTPLAQGARIRAVVQGPDGNLYASTDGKSGGDEIWKLTPQ
jgi:aldose sugar dehydrogenase